MKTNRKYLEMLPNITRISSYCQLVILLLFQVLVVSSYRQIHFTNADACDPDGSIKTQHIGEGALVLYLNNDSFSGLGTRNIHGDNKICNLKVKSRKGLGLLVYAEEFDLRQEKDDEGKERCLDYVEFGQDDVIPFITIKRSGRLCGDKKGAGLYDDPSGQLLIWLKLGASVDESLSPARLTLVITPYSTQPDTRNNQLQKCQRGNYWIRKKYFCDDRVNCPLDQDPVDEADISCATTPAPTTTSTTIRYPFSRDDGGIYHESLDYSFVLIVLVSIVGLLVIACGIVCTLKKCSLYPLPATPDSEHCPETSFGMLQVARNRSPAPENTYVTHPPCPRPPRDRPTDLTSEWTVSVSSDTSRAGASVTGHTTSIRMPKQSPLQSRAQEEAPPPSYNEIFPPDYVPDPSVMRGSSRQGDAAQQDTSV